MINLSWSDKRDLLFDLIKKISNHYGGDEKEWLRIYSEEVLEKYRNDIDTALLCFKDIESKLM